MKLFERHKPKRLDIGRPSIRYCTHCGKKLHCWRHSEYDFETGDEVKAAYHYSCHRCGVEWS